MKQKGFCIHCNSKDPLDHLITVDTNYKYTVCPNCGHKFLTNEAIHAFDIAVKKRLAYANSKLNYSNDFNKAYRKYAEVLYFDNENVTAMAGRIISLIMMSTLRESRFDEAMELLRIEKNIFRRVSSEFVYIDTIEKIIRICKQYKKRIYRRLTIHNYFYDSDCLHLYLERLNDIIELLNYIAKELDFLSERHPDLSPITMLIDVNNSFLEELNTSYKKPYQDVTGLTYKLATNPRIKKLTLSSDGNREHIELNKYRPYSLTGEGKDYKIKDVVFNRNGAINSLIHASLFLNILFLVLGASFILLSILKTDFVVLFIALGAVFLSLGIGIFILGIVIKHLQKKNELYQIFMK